MIIEDTDYQRRRREEEKRSKEKLYRELVQLRTKHEQLVQVCRELAGKLRRPQDFREERDEFLQFMDRFILREESDSV